MTSDHAETPAAMPVAQDETPFVMRDGKIVLDGQNSRPIVYGNSFDHARGYRPFFQFTGSDARNTWGPDDLLKWCGGVEQSDDIIRHVVKVARRLANQCIRMNREWERLGRPAGGLFDGTGGTS